jgi:hypothetical protein
MLLSYEPLMIVEKLQGEQGDDNDDWSLDPPEEIKA